MGSSDAIRKTYRVSFANEEISLASQPPYDPQSVASTRVVFALGLFLGASTNVVEFTMDNEKKR